MYLICKLSLKNKIEVIETVEKAEMLLIEKALKLAKYYYQKSMEITKDSTVIDIDTAKGEYIKQDCEIKNSYPYMNILKLLNTYEHTFKIEAKTLLHGE